MAARHGAHFERPSIGAGSSQRVPVVARRQRQTQQTQRQKESLSAVPSAATLGMVSGTVIRCRPRLRNKPLQTPAGEPGVSAACSQGWLRPGRLWGVDEQVKACGQGSLSSTGLVSGDLMGPFGGQLLIVSSRRHADPAERIFCLIFTPGYPVLIHRLTYWWVE
jgi:hypothetical protein